MVDPGWAYTFARTEATAEPLHWPHGAEIHWRAESSKLSSVSRDAVQPWLAVACKSSLPGAVEMSSTAVNIRTISAPDAWPLGSDVIAFTALVHNSGSGLVSGFSMHFNGVSQVYCRTEKACAGAEVHLRTALAHEWGHVFGLGHSTDPAALMTEMRYPGEVMTALHQDDRAGICALYNEPAHPGNPSHGCSAAVTPSSRSATLWCMLAVMLMLGFHRRFIGMIAPSSLAKAGTRALRRLAPFALVALYLPLLAVTDASAFVFARSDSGAHQRWYAGEVPYSIEKFGLSGQGIDDEAIIAAAARSFQTWSSVQCDLCHDPRSIACEPVACGSHPLGLSFKFVGLTPERLPLDCADGSTPGPDNTTCKWVPNGSQLSFIGKNWVHGSAVIATTVVAANQLTGEIADADIQLNIQDKIFCAESCKLAEYNLDNTLTHEIGHLLGLDHSLDGHATMFGGAPAGETSKIDLHPDDIAGVCRAYRQAWTQGGCPPVDDGLCQVTAHHGALPPGTPARMLVLIALGWLTVSLRRRVG
ncbi:MAG: matrixin family metalloprotease [Myxococcales bacterium]|nr:matrixin family metalloprotease [Myxococcales bacterium]